MGKRRIFLLAAVILAIAIGFIWLLPQATPDPLYRGKPLSYWLRAFGPDASYSYDIVQPTYDQATEAIDHVGTNAIPYLLHLLRQKDSPLKPSLVAIAKRQNLIPVYAPNDSQRASRAFQAFEILGPKASNAVPDLIAIFNRRITADSRRGSLRSLLGIGPAARAAIPALFVGTRDTDQGIRSRCILAIGQLHPDPAQVVPGLLDLLHDSDRTSQAFAMQVLGEFGADAASAIPALTQLLTNQDLGLQTQAKRALDKITNAPPAKK